MSIKECRARALLRAAAPKLLKACKDALEGSLLPMTDNSGRRSCHYCAFIEGHHPTCIFGRIEAAIAEAKGEKN